MRRLLTFALFATLACGPGPTEVGEDLPFNIRLSIITVEATLEGDSVVAEVTNDSGDPQPGVVVNFEVRGEDCGSWVTGTLQTNSDGLAVNVPTAGTRAWTHPDYACEYRVTRSRDGRPDLVEVVDMTVEPGVVVDAPNRGKGFRFFPSPHVIDIGRDEHGNPGLAWAESMDTTVVSVEGRTPGTPEARTVRSEGGDGPVPVCARAGATDSLVVVWAIDADGDKLGGEVSWVADGSDVQQTFGPEGC